MPPVQQSASKWELFLVLDLEEGNAAHDNLYKSMKDEAKAMYDAVLKGRRTTLKPQFATAPEPWSFSQFSDSAIRQAIERICSRASSQTRPYYARAPMGGDNWVARWFLYHVCRYRDSRNVRSRGGNDPEYDEADRARGPNAFSGSSSSKSSLTKSGGAFYDAARNTYRTT